MNLSNDYKNLDNFPLVFNRYISTAELYYPQPFWSRILRCLDLQMLSSSLFLFFLKFFPVFFSVFVVTFAFFSFVFFCFLSLVKSSLVFPVYPPFAVWWSRMHYETTEVRSKRFMMYVSRMIYWKKRTLLIVMNIRLMLEVQASKWCIHWKRNIIKFQWKGLPNWIVRRERSSLQMSCEIRCGMFSVYPVHGKRRFKGKTFCPWRSES